MKIKKINQIFFVSIIVLSLLLVLICMINLYKKENFDINELKNIDNVGNIPKIIWSYWDKGLNNSPELVKKSYSSWKKYNPDYKIIFLDDNNVNEYIDTELYFNKIIVKNSYKQKKADLIRCILLADYGGIWIDSSLLLTESLDWIIEKENNGQYNLISFYQEGFTKNEDKPVIENWFLAVSKNNEFMKLWKDDFFYYLQVGYKKYMKTINNKVDIQNIDNPKYLTMHVSAQKIMTQNPHLIKEIFSIKSGSDPFYLHFKMDWDITKLSEYICKNKDVEYVPKMIKFRGTDREIFEKYLLENIDDINKINGTIYEKYLKNL